jgi:hypothetical protein
MLLYENIIIIAVRPATTAFLILKYLRSSCSLFSIYKHNLFSWQNCDSYEARLKMLGRSTSGEEDSSKRRQLSPALEHEDDQYR